MGLVKTRRLASMYKQERAKAGMKPPMKGAFRSIPEREFEGTSPRPVDLFLWQICSFRQFIMIPDGALY